MSKLNGTVALVTGAARGLGADIARAVVAAGGKVVITDLRDELGTQVATELGDAAIYRHHDVTKAAEWAAVVDETVRHFGSLTGLVNNAVRNDMSPFDRLTEKDFREVFEVNELGCFLGMKAAIPAMRRAGHGSIVNVSSTAGMHPSGGTAYSASKWAIRGMSKVVANEMGPENIRVNSLHPGWMRTPATEHEPLDEVAKFLPLRQVGDTRDVAKSAVFLLSDEANLITGTEFLVDGGALLLGSVDMARSILS
ncbi:MULTISPECIES: glucose 1-dehydrogenase [Rhodomicrobium]|uniref:SDR family NAD(P)-dependent oxidoreductase n=1 Tax=Rhodomicrobium TaxID=1068 RepID=UPI000B4ADCCB|nr:MULTISPECIES: glucose 1-dehydrogenase [Rhodomicrobium]